MKYKRWIVWGFTLGAATWMTSFASADGYQLSNSQPTTTQYQRPEDLLDKVPFISAIPRSLFFGDGYKVKLGTTDLRIDHMATNSRSAGKQRTCVIGFSYSTPVAGFFTSRIDLPIFNSPDLHMADWGTSSFGDYIAQFSKGATNPASMQLVMTARF